MSNEKDPRGEFFTYVNRKHREGETTFKPWIVDPETGVMVDFIVGKRKEGWIDLAVRIFDNTTIDSIRDAWPFITHWRDLLREFQGPWFHGANEFYEHLLVGFDKYDFTYRQLAEKVNNRISQLLQGYHEYTKWEARTPMPETYEKVMEWLTDHPGDRVGLRRALEMMELMGLSEDEAKKWVQIGLDNIEAGWPAFDTPGTPVKSSQVEWRIRKWREVREAYKDHLGLGKIG